MRNIVLAAAALMLTAAAQPVTPAPVVAAERAFARDGGAMGVGPSFLKWSVADAVMIGPTGVTHPKEAFAGPPPSGPQPKLAWWPLFAGIAQSGDLGFTTGPVEVGGARQGHYFTVWKKQADGGWKWIYDGGVGASSATEAPATTEPVYLPVSTAKPLAPNRALQAVDQAEADLAARARADSRMALSAAFAETGRLYVAPQPPAVGNAAIAAAVQAYPASLEFGPPAGGEASGAGDMAYVYGPVSGQGLKGMYVHFWQRRTDGWKLVFAQIVPTRP
jgi:ketosteroid isomerase-like protein